MVKKLILLPYFDLNFKVVGIPYTLLKFRKNPRVAQHTTNWPQHQCYGYRPTGLAQVIWRFFFNKLLKFNLTNFFLNSGTMNLGGSLTRQIEQDASVSEASPHIANIGKMVEEMENKIRYIPYIERVRNFRINFFLNYDKSWSNILQRKAKQKDISDFKHWKMTMEIRKIEKFDAEVAEKVFHRH